MSGTCFVSGVIYVLLSSSLLFLFLVYVFLAGCTVPKRLSFAVLCSFVYLGLFGVLFQVLFRYSFLSSSLFLGATVCTITVGSLLSLSSVLPLFFISVFLFCSDWLLALSFLLLWYEIPSLGGRSFPVALLLVVLNDVVFR